MLWNSPPPGADSVVGDVVVVVDGICCASVVMDSLEGLVVSNIFALKLYY